MAQVQRDDIIGRCGGYPEALLPTRVIDAASSIPTWGVPGMPMEMASQWCSVQGQVIIQAVSTIGMLLGHIITHSIFVSRRTESKLTARQIIKQKGKDFVRTLPISPSRPG